jgi:hypothetical protein
MLRELERVLDDDVLICLLRVRPSYFIVSESGRRSCGLLVVGCGLLSIGSGQFESTVPNGDKSRPLAYETKERSYFLRSHRKPRFTGNH